MRLIRDNSARQQCRVDLTHIPFAISGKTSRIQRHAQPSHSSQWKKSKAQVANRAYWGTYHLLFDPYIEKAIPYGLSFATSLHTLLVRCELEQRRQLLGSLCTIRSSQSEDPRTGAAPNAARWRDRG